MQVRKVLMVVYRNGIKFSISLLKNNNLFDTKMCNRKYTWCNNHVEPTFAKLDRFLVTMDWLDHYPKTCVSALSREWSYHTPLLIDTGTWCVKPF
jgi:hypothetical protein